MRNLFSFLQQYSTAFVFILLQIICFKMMIDGNHDKKQTFLNTSRAVTGTVFKEKKRVTDYFQLTEINDSLLQENTRLKTQLYQEKTILPTHDSTTSVVVTRDSVKKTIRYQYFSAKVIDNTFDQVNNYVTINKGVNNNIRTGMAVLSNNGIVGKVVQVSANFAVIKSVLSKRFAVSAKLKDGTIGKIAWNDLETKYVDLEDINQNVKALPGDTVYTSGYSLFPENIIIGRLAAVKSGESGNSNTFKVLLSTNFRKLHYVYVVKDISGEIITALQDSAKAMDILPDKKPNTKKNNN